MPFNYYIGQKIWLKDHFWVMKKQIVVWKDALFYKDDISENVYGLCGEEWYTSKRTSYNKVKEVPRKRELVFLVHTSITNLINCNLFPRKLEVFISN